MASGLALPARGDVLVDARGEGRALRVSWHTDDDVVVLSLWRAGTCAGTFRLARGDVPALVESLLGGLLVAQDDPQVGALG